MHRGDYANVLHHLAVISLTCMAVGEEIARVLVTEDEMDKLVEATTDGLSTMVHDLMVDLRRMKDEDA